MTYSKNSGFTIIELIVVIGMLSALAGYFVMNSAGVRNAQNLDLAAKQVVSAIREAQALGQSGRAFGTGTCSDGSSKFDCGYGVYLTKVATGGANTKIIIYGGAGDGENGGSPFSTDDKYVEANKDTSMTLPGGVKVSGICVNGASCGKDEVHILTRRGKATQSIHAPSTDYAEYAEITVSSGGNTKVVYVNKYGVVYVK